VIGPDGTTSAAEFLHGVREWGGFDNLDVSIEDRVVTEEEGEIVSRSTRVFRWKGSGEVAYEQPAEARVTVEGGRITRVEMR